MSRPSVAPGRTDLPQVAVVDDDPRIRQSLKDLFRSAGLQVRVFSSGVEVLSSNNLDGISCLITDIRMSQMDGWELKARVTLSYPDLPVIFVTAHDDGTLKRRADASGVFASFLKPFDAEELLCAVEEAIRKFLHKRSVTNP